MRDVFSFGQLIKIHEKRYILVYFSSIADCRRMIDREIKHRERNIPKRFEAF